MNLVERPTAIDHADPFPVFSREAEVSVSDLFVKRSSFIVQPIAALISAACAVKSRLQIDIKVNREVGVDSVTCDVMKLHNDIRAESAALALVRQGGIRESVREHNCARTPLGKNNFIEVLCTSSEVQ